MELDPAGEPSEPQRDESSFGSVDDFSELMEDEEPAIAVDLASEIASELEQEAAAAEIEEVGTDPESGSKDDLGDPESWDLVGGDEFAVGQSSLGGMSASFARTQALGSVEVGEFFSDDGLTGAAYDDESASSSILAGSLGQVGRIAGWAISLALVAAVLILAAQSEWARWAQTPQVVSQGPLQAETSSSGWVQTSRLRADSSLRGPDPEYGRTGHLARASFSSPCSVPRGND